MNSSGVLIGNTPDMAQKRAALGTADKVQAGLRGGLLGGVIIWIYEAIVWVGVQHLMPLAGIPRNATGLVFGKAVQDQLGGIAYVVGTGIHFVFALGWGVAFAFAWPWFARRGYEAGSSCMSRSCWSPTTIRTISIPP
jgi:hypothetical protein